jgi:hypothetical protein
MVVDLHNNAAISAVATAPSPAISGTSLVVTGGEGARFPTPPFNATIWPTGTQPSYGAGTAVGGNFEIVRVTAISTDTLTIVRVQEGSGGRSVVIGDQIAATITAKTLTDAETAAVAYFTPTLTNRASSNSETVIASFPLLAGELAVGKLYRLVISFYVSSSSSENTKVRIGTAGTIADAQIIPSINSTPNGVYAVLEAYIRCTAVGASGSVSGASFSVVGTGTNTSSVSGSSATVDTTVANFVTVSSVAGAFAQALTVQSASLTRVA